MSTPVTPASGGATSTQHSSDAKTGDKKAASGANGSGARQKTTDASDLSGFWTKLKAKTEAAKLKDLKPALNRRSKDLIAAVEAGISATDIAAELIDTVAFFKDMQRSVVVAAIEEIVQKEQAKAEKG